MPLPNIVAATKDSLLRHLQESERGFRLGMASDTWRYGSAISQSDQAIVAAYRELVAEGKVTETKTRFRSSGAYHSVYRLAEQPTERLTNEHPTQQHPRSV